MKRIYIANLSKYVSGKLVGQWIELPIDEDDLRQKINDILGSDEEIAIHDYENMPFDVSEYDNVFDINNFIRFIKETEIPEEVVLHMMENYSGTNKFDITNYQEREFLILHDINDYSDLAYELWSEVGYFPEITKEVEKYIDWEKIGRDLDCEGEWTLGDNKTAILILD